MQKLVGSLTTVLTPPNLLANPSVEEPPTGDWPSDWNWSAANATRVATEAYDGTHSLRLNPTAATAEWVALPQAVTPGASYRLGTHVKGSGSNQTFLTVRWWAEAGRVGFVSEQNIALEGTFADWTEKSGVFVAPPTAHYADVDFRCPAATTADIYGDLFYLGPA